MSELSDLSNALANVKLNGQEGIKQSDLITLTVERFEKDYVSRKLYDNLAERFNTVLSQIEAHTQSMNIVMEEQRKEEANKFRLINRIKELEEELRKARSVPPFPEGKK